MQYGELITRSFSIIWRHKYLWLLAILGGADVGAGEFPGGNFNGLGNVFNGGSPSGTATAGSPPSFQDASNAFGQFVLNNLGLIVSLGVLAVVVGILWFLLSCVTTGALVRATAEHDADRPFDLGLAWRTGLGTFGAILGLRLIGLLWGVLVLGVLAGTIALAVAAFVGGQNATGGLVIFLGLLVLAVLLLASIPIGIAFILGTRAIVLEQRGPLSGLGRGFQLLGSRLGRALLVWLLQVGLALAAGFGLAIALIPVYLILTIAVVAAAVAGGAGAGVGVGIPLGLLLLAVTVVVGGVVNSYFSAYWTLAFRRMEVDAPPPVAWPQTPYYGPPPSG
ncbi:MAG TPA: hypothetical protein VE953_07270 [Terriglobales bacterium]|nr:hypothetical protein [Terriglobales bacterium]